MARKTVSVDSLKTEINRLLALDPTRITVDQRKILSHLLENVLMESGNYRGYGHLHWMKEGGYEQWREAGQPEDASKAQFIYGSDSDDWRREYM